MTFALGALSLSRCARVDPRMMAVAKLAISVSTQDFGFTEEQSRTIPEELEKVHQGVSHTMHSHHLVNSEDHPLTWEPLQSAIGFSGAVDAVPWVAARKAFVWDWELIYPIVAAFKAASLTLATPVTWGGCWGKLLSEIPGNDAAAMKAARVSWDGPHFELGRN